MGTVHHLRPCSKPRRIAAPDQHLLVDGTLHATISLHGKAAEKVIVDAGMAMKPPGQYLSDFVAWMVLLEDRCR